MSVRSEVQSQLLSYAVGEMDLRSFREWHLSKLVDDSSELNPQELELLHAVEARFADRMAGLSEAAFKESIKALLSPETQQAPMQYLQELELFKDAVARDTARDCARCGHPRADHCQPGTMHTNHKEDARMLDIKDRRLTRFCTTPHCKHPLCSCVEFT